MLVLNIGEAEAYDDEKQEFVMIGGTRLEFEHSLSSLSKWESTYEKPFLAGDKTREETLGYIQLMCLTPNVPDEVWQTITPENIHTVQNYIEAKMTATWFPEEKNSPGARDVITAEIIYYWMVSLNVPFECETWHLNRLLTLIKVINKKNQPEKKMSRRDIAVRNRQLNAQRKAQMGTRG